MIRINEQKYGKLLSGFESTKFADLGTRISSGECGVTFTNPQMGSCTMYMSPCIVCYTYYANNCLLLPSEQKVKTIYDPLFTSSPSPPPLTSILFLLQEVMASLFSSLSAMSCSSLCRLSSSFFFFSSFSFLSNSAR